MNSAQTSASCLGEFFLLVFFWENRYVSTACYLCCRDAARYLNAPLEATYQAMRTADSHHRAPEILHELLQSEQRPTVVDLRLPLDFLTHAEIIPNALRISPEDIVATPQMIPKDQDYVLYCTCPAEVSSKTVLATALSMGFMRVKLLKGGLEGWEAKGYPVEPYDKPFYLDRS